MFKHSVSGFALALALSASLAIPALLPSVVEAADTSGEAKIDAESRAALEALLAANPTAKTLSAKARGILIFPGIVKAGLGIGGAYGEGEALQDGKVVGYYNSVSGSIGLQAGIQQYGYAVFLMTDDAVNYLRDSDGWEIGVGPTVVVVDEGMAKNLSTTTLSEAAYAVIFDQKGLMAGISLEGTKITAIKP